MVTITVKYLGWTETKASRLKARCGKKSITISKPDHTHHGDETAFEAVRAFIDRHAPQWRDCVWASGYVEQTQDFVFTYLAPVDSPIGAMLMAGSFNGDFFVHRSHAEPMIGAIVNARGGGN